VAAGLVFVSHDRAFIDAVATAHRGARPRRAAQLPRRLRRLSRRSRCASSRPRRWPMPAPTSCSRRRRCGCARAWKPGARAASGAWRGWRRLRARRAERREQLGQVRLALDTGLPSGPHRGRAAGRGHALRRARARAGPVGHHPARRQGRPDRPQRQPARPRCSSSSWASSSPPSAACAAARSCRWPTSTRCAPRSTSTRRWPTPSARAASGWRSAPRAST
jgi:hypothetical protein